MRLTMGVLGLVVASVAAGRAAERALADGGQVELALLQLRLTYNTGAAFSLGAGLPDGVILVVTAVISAAIAIYTWRIAPGASWTTRLGLVAVLAGAVSNLIDRADDGAVIDYLHTGWWPTFNLPDTLITVGGGVLVLAAVRSGPESGDEKASLPPDIDASPKAPIEPSGVLHPFPRQSVERSLPEDD